MRDFRDAKAMAQTLREALKSKSVSVTHSESLELIARLFGFPDWNFLAARIQASQSASAPLQTQAPALRAAPAGAIVPVLALRDLVLFPQMVAPIFVGREKTKRAIAHATATGGRILVVTQKRATDDDPALDALYSVGVTASVIHNVTLVDGTFKLFVSGIERAAVVRPVEEEFLVAEAAPIEETGGQTAEATALFGAVLEAYQIWAKVDFSTLPEESRARLFLPRIEDPGILADAIAPLLQVSIEQRQAILETRDVVTRLETILALLKAAQQAA
jgi:ATP-dependent Lon protease